MALYHTLNRRPPVEDQRARKAAFRSLLRTLGPWLPEDRSTPVLDAGCGEGTLLCLLRSLGYMRLEGFDLSEENVGICHGRGLDFVLRFDAARLASFPGLRRYGVVFAMDLIEHLPKAQAAGFLEQVRAMLLPGGAAVVQTPNMGGLAGCFYRYNDLSHEFGLSEQTAATLLRLAGFAPEEVEVRAAWGATRGLGRAREIYLRLLHRLIWASDGAARPRIASRNLLIRAVRS